MILWETNQYRGAAMKTRHEAKAEVDHFPNNTMSRNVFNPLTSHQFANAYHYLFIKYSLSIFLLFH